MSGTLFVVATPIGNLEDVTLRALRILREVDLIAAEDTRRTSRLLARHGIATRSVSFHQHNVRMRLPLLLTHLRDGRSIALVTDAGTPGISDPGTELVQECLREGISVDPVPGVSAPLAAAVVSGFPLVPLTIFGFPPRRAQDRTSWIQVVSSLGHTCTFFESPHRIVATLHAAAELLGDRQIVVAREMTKQHQEFLRGSCSQVAELLENPIGEFTVVVSPLKKEVVLNDHKDVGATTRGAVALFNSLMDAGALSRREALREAARRFHLPTRSVYAAVEDARKSGE